MKKVDSFPALNASNDNEAGESLTKVVDEMPKLSDLLPPAIFVIGHVAGHHVSVPAWSYTLALNVSDMYQKAARRLKSAADVTVFATNGQWEKTRWTTLSHSKIETKSK